ncbi:MAG TPA: bestrophin family ion channel [Cyclobacteriaceae bacterium]|nr:bestrophin family ion channel [Cyclobacteriaceae bacterium]
MVQYNPKTWGALIFHAYSRHVIRRLWPSIAFMGLFTAAFCYLIIGVLAMDYRHFPGNTSVHSLLGIVLGLFLVFRTNSAYDRWWEGRRMWGGLVNSTRNLAIKLNAYVSPEAHEQREWFAAMISNFVYATKEHLRYGVQLEQLESVDAAFIQFLKGYRHRPNRIASMLYDRINLLYKEGLLSGDQLINLDKEMKDFIDLLGGCERIKNTPIPYSYTMYIKKFIFSYIITLPFGFVSTFGYFTIPTVMFITYILLSVELIAEEIEDPFGKDLNDLPTDELSQKIKENVKEILQVV